MDFSGSVDWDTVELPDFGSLPWIVSDRQRPLLLKYKRLAVLKEKELNAERQRQLNELRHYVETRIRQLETKTQTQDGIPNKGVVHSHSLSLQDELGAGSSLRENAAIDDTHISEEGDKTRAWMMSVLQPLAESPSVLPEVSSLSMQQRQTAGHQHQFVDSYSQEVRTQLEMSEGKATMSNTGRTQTRSFLLPPQSTAHNALHGLAGRESAPFMATVSEQTVGSTSQDPNWRPLTGKKMDRWRCGKVHACVKGYLTWRLYHSNKVQHLRTTAQDAEAVLSSLPKDAKKMSQQDLQLKERVTTQLLAAKFAVYEIFFELSPRDRMACIAQTRHAAQEKVYRREPSVRAATAPVDPSTKRLSSATLKKIEQRKQAASSPSTVMRGAGKRSVRATSKGTKEAKSSSAPGKKQSSRRPR